MGVAVRARVGSRSAPGPRSGSSTPPRTWPPQARAARPPRRLLPDPVVAVHRRDPGPRDGLVGRANSGSSTRPSPASARSTRSTASCRAGGRRSSPRWRPRTAATSTAWRWTDGRPKYVTVLARDRHAARLAAGQGDRRLPDRRRQRRDGRAGLRHAALAAGPRRAGLAAALGRGRLVRGRPGRRAGRRVAELPGYARGLAFAGPFAFIGLSKIRETSTFGGVPDRRAARRSSSAASAWSTCGPGGSPPTWSSLGDRRDLRRQVLPGARSRSSPGPYPDLDGGQPIWTVPTRDPLSRAARG